MPVMLYRHARPHVKPKRDPVTVTWVVLSRWPIEPICLASLGHLGRSELAIIQVRHGKKKGHSHTLDKEGVVTHSPVLAVHQHATRVGVWSGRPGQPRAGFGPARPNRKPSVESCLCRPVKPGPHGQV
jgi:hypothetical protein